MRELIVARAAENKTQSIFRWLFVENNSLSEGLAGFRKARNRHRCESFKEGVRPRFFKLFLILLNSISLR